MVEIFPHDLLDEVTLTYQKNQPYEYEFLSGYYLFELWGASGGGLNPGFGAFVSGVLTIKKKLTLYFYIGQKGQNGENIAYNGGGKGQERGSSGGGSTDIRLNKGEWNDFDSLKSRIIIAGAGGGSESVNTYLSKGGNAGIIQGENGQSSKKSGTNVKISEGGKQTQEGKKGEPLSSGFEGTNGAFGYGGDGSIGDYHGNGGGSGYFGGGGGASADNVVGSGAGGSSYVSGYNGCISILQNSTIEKTLFSENSHHYSGLSFYKISVKSGSEVQWNDNGKIRIVFIKKFDCFCTYKTNFLPFHMFIIFILCLIK